MKKLLITVLSAICVIACIMSLAACSGNTYLGTYYGGYPNDPSADKVVISRRSVSSGGTDYPYTVNSDNAITLSTGVEMRFAENYQVAYLPKLKWQQQGGISTRNGYFNAQLTSFSNYQLAYSYQFYTDGTFRFVNVQSSKITTGTYYLKNGVLSVFYKNETGSVGSVSLNSLHLLYIDESYNIYSGAVVKDYTKFQETDDDTGDNGNPDNGNGSNNGSDNGNSSVYQPHTLTYDFNYYDANPTTQQVTKGEKVNLILPTREGCKFSGWYCDGSKVESGIWQYDSDITLTAYWEEINYTVTYNTNGGTMPDVYLKTFSVSNSYDFPYTLPVPAKQGFNFAGWYETENFSGDPITTIPQNSLRDYVLYAKYSDEQLLKFELSFDETYYSVVGYQGAPQYLTVPATKDGLPVKEIATAALKDCTTLINITLPDSICKIGGSAFYGCYHLTNIIIPDGVTSIESQTFYNCSNLTSVIIPNSVTGIGDSVFSDCDSLTNVTIPDSVTSIGSYAFSGCNNLTSITIPDSVTSIGESAFSGCDSLTSIILNGGITSINRSTFSRCNKLTSVTIPESVTSIADEAFYGCSSLTNIILPESVNSVDSSAFPDKLYKRYNGCYYLPTTNSDYGFLLKVVTSDMTNVRVHNDCKIINKGTFARCSSLESVIMPNGLTSIGGSAFSGCSNLTSVTIPNSVTSIGEEAFYNCDSLTNIVIPDGVTSIERRTFLGCSNLTSVTIPDGVTSISDGAFYGCSSLTNIIIPDSVTNIGDRAFYDCDSLTNIVIPDRVTTIGEYAFSCCDSLTSVIIPNSVTSIGEYAFWSCNRLTHMFYKGTAESWKNITNDYYYIPYYFSAAEPESNADGTAYNGRYWHYDTDGKTPVVWQKQNIEETL